MNTLLVPPPESGALYVTDRHQDPPISFFSFRTIYLNGVQMLRGVPLRTRHSLSFTHYHCLQLHL
jgi:hypothetical protein